MKPWAWLVAMAVISQAAFAQTTGSGTGSNQTSSSGSTASSGNNTGTNTGSTGNAGSTTNTGNTSNTGSSGSSGSNPSQGDGTDPFPYDYRMQVRITMPAGSAGASLRPNQQPSASPFTPCDAQKIDSVSIRLDYSAGDPTRSTTMRDVYVILYTPNAQVGQQYHVGVRGPAAMQTFQVLSSPAELNQHKRDYIYLRKELNPSGIVSENLVASLLPVDGVPMGTWQVIGIVADRNYVDFTNPDTWDAWDVATVVLGRPWLTGQWLQDECR